MRALAFSAVASLAFVGPLGAQELSPEATRFFEEKVRPVLHAKCLLCHNDTTRISRLSLGRREGPLPAGRPGPAVGAADTGNSLLVQAVRDSGDL